MNPNLALQLNERIRNLQAGRLATANPHTILRADVLGGFRFLRVLGVARLHQDEPAHFMALARQYQVFLAGLHRAQLSWAFVVRLQPAEMAVYLGLACTQSAIERQGRLLMATVPGCELSPGPEPVALSQTLTSLPWVAAMTGNPSVQPYSSESRQTSSIPSVGHLESMLRAVRAEELTYAVISHPVSPAAIENDLRQLADEERETVSAFQRRGSAEENNHPLASRYIELLHVARQKHQLGLQQGMWDALAFILARDAEALGPAMQAASAAYAGPFSQPQPFQVFCLNPGQPVRPERLLTRLTTADIGALAHPPGAEFSGYRIREQVAFAVSATPIASGQRLAIGTITDQGQPTGNWLELGLNSLCMHAFVAGTTGSGKTTTCQFLLRQLWETHRIPWLVLEPSMKTEYRSLIFSPLGDALRVFTLGDETGVPFRFNPLEVLPNVPVQLHIDGLAALFNAAFAWVPPMPTVLSLALHRLYSERGWDLASGCHPRGHIAEVQPTITDLIRTVETVVRELGYDPEVSGNIRAGLKTRLTHLTVGGKGLMLNSGVSLPWDYLLEQPTVLEFSAIGNDEEKAFVLGALLLRLSEFRQVAGSTGGQLQHVTLIEEAHRLLRATPQSIGDESANPRGQAIATFCNLLAELRAYGEGLIVVDQIPAKLEPDVIKNTNLKIVHRLLAEDDRRLVGGCMNLTEAQQRYLVGLKAGDAVAHSQHRETAYLLRIPDHTRAYTAPAALPTRLDVKNHMRGRVPTLAPTRVASGSATGRPDNIPACPACGTGQCAWRATAMDQLLRGDHSRAFGTALEGGAEALWEFGASVARSGWAPGLMPPDAPYCVVMNIAAIAGFTDEEVQILRRRLDPMRQQASAHPGRPA